MATDKRETKEYDDTIMKSSRFPAGMALLTTAVLAWLLSAILLKHIEKAPPTWQMKKWTMPGYKTLKLLALGHETALSGLLWIDCLFTYVSAGREGEEVPHLARALFTLTDLNPGLEYAYTFGGLILAESPATREASIQLLNKGIETFPDNYRLRLYAAMSQLAIDSNHAEAARYLLPLIQSNDTPFYIKNYAVTLLAKAGKKEDAVLFLLINYAQSNNQLHREVLFKKLAGLLKIPGNSRKLGLLRKILSAIDNVNLPTKEAVQEILKLS